MGNKLLITGGSGLVGSAFTKIGLERNHTIQHLGRVSHSGVVPTYSWNIVRKQIDTKAFDTVDTIIHLAGAGIAEKRWTPSRKKEILDSRVLSTRLLYETLSSIPNQVNTIISASAIGIYGLNPSSSNLSEQEELGNDFLATVTQQWETELKKFTSLNMRVVILRLGIVLSNQGGALMKMEKPIRYGIGAVLGTGKQPLSWIHIDDLCNLLLKATEDPLMQGTYNAVAPNPTTNREMTQAIANELNKPLWLPPIPPFIVKILVGEMAQLVLTGAHVSCQKLQKSGFQFNYPDIQAALKNLLGQSACSALNR